jgi:hypothetical protein
MKKESIWLSVALLSGFGHWMFWPGFHQLFLLVVFLWSLYFLFCLVKSLIHWRRQENSDPNVPLLIIAKWSLLIWITAKLEFYFWQHEWGLVTFAFILFSTIWIAVTGVIKRSFRWDRWSMQFVSLLVLSIVLLNISELQLVKWRYRKYPAFVQAFEFYQLDPNNPELQDQLFLEHQRIVLTEQEFLELQHKMKRERRHKNQW